jgi:hypothetical protein
MGVAMLSIDYESGHWTVKRDGAVLAFFQNFSDTERFLDELEIMTNTGSPPGAVKPSSEQTPSNETCGDPALRDASWPTSIAALVRRFGGKML